MKFYLNTDLVFIKNILFNFLCFIIIITTNTMKQGYYTEPPQPSENVIDRTGVQTH